jgi:CMP-2-keto-3-deoxyoctulosonic acid synthetase
MLRLLENGEQIRMVLSEYPVVGVDTPQDVNRVEFLMEKDPYFMVYKGQTGKC